MIKIAICDDEPYFLEKINCLVNQNFSKLGEQAEIRKFSSATELIGNVQYLESCNVVFMDINMPNCNGFEYATRIKKKSPNIYLVFVTVQIDYMLKGYQVEAFRYILKSDLEGQMQECISSLIQKIRKGNYSMNFMFREGEITLKLSNIKYIESYKHTMLFHMRGETNNIHEMVSSNLSMLEKQLSSFGFFRVHKSYLVNMLFADGIERYELRLSENEKIPIPKDKYTEVRAQYYKMLGDM